MPLVQPFLVCNSTASCSGISCSLCVGFCICDRAVSCNDISCPLCTSFHVCNSTASFGGIGCPLCVGFCMGYCTASCIGYVAIALTCVFDSLRNIGSAHSVVIKFIIHNIDSTKSQKVCSLSIVLVRGFESIFERTRVPAIPLRFNVSDVVSPRQKIQVAEMPGFASVRPMDIALRALLVICQPFLACPVVAIDFIGAAIDFRYQTRLVNRAGSCIHLISVGILSSRSLASSALPSSNAFTLLLLSSCLL